MSESSRAMARPPEGAIVGESVPAGSEPDERTEQLIEHTMNWIKTHDPSGTELSNDERREKAKSRLRSLGVSL
jgi:hypothetical protein